MRRAAGVVRAHVRLAQQAPAPAADEETFTWRAVVLGRAHVQAAEVVAPGLPVQFAAGDDGLRLAVHEPDTAREEAVEGQIEIGLAVEEERASFGQEQREPREVHQPLIDFGLGEVGVDRGHGAQARREVVGEVDADVSGGVTADRRCAAGRGGGVARGVRPHFEAAAGADVAQAQQQAGIGHALQALVPLVAGPQQLLLLAAHGALEVDAPRRRVGIEGQAAEGQVDLQHPADLALPGAGVPDAVPLAGIGAARRLQRIGHQAGRVHLEEVARLLVQERVHRPHEPVVGAEELVALAGVALQLVGFGVVERRADVQVVLVVDDAHLGTLGRRAAEHRVLHDELPAMLGTLPDGFVEHAIEHDLLAGAHALGGHGAPARLHDLQLRGGLGVERGREQQGARAERGEGDPTRNLSHAVPPR